MTKDLVLSARLYQQDEVKEDLLLDQVLTPGGRIVKKFTINDEGIEVIVTFEVKKAKKEKEVKEAADPTQTSTEKARDAHFESKADEAAVEEALNDPSPSISKMNKPTLLAYAKRKHRLDIDPKLSNRKIKDKIYDAEEEAEEAA